MLACLECGYERSQQDSNSDDEKVFKDVDGTILQDVDTVAVIKDLKVKDSSLVVKASTKVKSIRLKDGDHAINCKVDG